MTRVLTNVLNFTAKWPVDGALVVTFTSQSARIGLWVETWAEKQNGPEGVFHIMPDNPHGITISQSLKLEVPPKIPPLGSRYPTWQGFGRRCQIQPRTESMQATREAALIECIKADRKIIDDTHHITQKRGNGQLRREIWVDAQGQVTRYNLAYINHALHAGDNRRVVGYDNQRGYHHRHYFGVVAAVEFTSFDGIEDQFQADWAALRRTA